MRKLLLMLSVLLVSGLAYAQNYSISGKVTDAVTLEPLPFVTVLEKGTNRFATTDDSGNYRLMVSGVNAVIEFRIIGYAPLELTVTSPMLNAALSSDALGLDEVVVIGYGTQRKADVSSAISSVKSEDFVKAVVQDAAQLIQGRVAGLVISNPSGDPTQGSQMLLRGSSSINGSTRPLVLIDGIRGDINTVPPEDIEAIDVLKDASAASIYGTRGAAGVILITTRRSRNDMRQSVEYNTNLQIRNWYKKQDFMSADDLRARWREGETFIGANIQDFGGNTNWLDEISQTGVAQVHNLTFRGGSRSTNYVATLNYRDMSGNFILSDNKNYMGRANISHTMFDGVLKLDFGAILTKQWGNGNSFNASFDRQNAGGDAYRQASIRNPTEPVYGRYVNDGDGYGHFEPGDMWAERPVYVYQNPVAVLRESIRSNVSRSTRLTAGATLTPIKDLNFLVTYTMVGRTSQSGQYNTLKHYQNVIQSNGGSATLRSGDDHTDIFEVTGNYKFSLKESHHFTAMAGYSYEYNFGSSMSMTNSIFPTDAYGFWNIGTGGNLKAGNASMSSSASMDRLIAFLGRVTYNYKDKYLLTASLRHEGSSRFGKDTKWGNFPGLSAAWRMDNEGFMKDIKWLNLLKLRASWGITGVNAGNRLESLARLEYATSGFFYSGGNWIAPLTPAANANPDLRWERKNEFNVGLDATFLGGRLSASLDAFYNKVTDGLYRYNVPSPPYLYNRIYANVYELENVGMEGGFNVVPVRKKNFEWNASFTYSYIKNKVLSIQSTEFPLSTNYIEEAHLGEPIQQYSQRLMPGYPMGTFWGLKSVDITDAGRWIVEGKDENGNFTVLKTIATNTGYPRANEDDKQVLGCGMPQHQVSWNNAFYYKKFHLNVNMRGAFGFQILNHQRMYYENKNIQYNVLNSAFDPVYGKAQLGESQEYVSYYIEQGDYWKIDNITFGYSFDLSKINKIIRGIQADVSMMNIATITGYKGLDPEVPIQRGGAGIGFDARDRWPTVRTYTFRLNFTF